MVAKKAGSGVRQTWVGLPVPQLLSCVTLGKLLHSSESQTSLKETLNTILTS